MFKKNIDVVKIGTFNVRIFCKRGNVTYIADDKANLIRNDKNEEYFILKKSVDSSGQIRIKRKTTEGMIQIYGSRRKGCVLIHSPKKGVFLPMDIDDSKIAPISEDMKRWFADEIQNSHIRWKPPQNWIERNFTLLSFIILGTFFLMYLWVIGGDISPAVRQMDGALKVMSDAMRSFTIISPP